MPDCYASHTNITHSHMRCHRNTEECAETTGGHRFYNKQTGHDPHAQSGHMSQVSIARRPESWLPNQIAVLPIRWRNNELVFSITCEPSISRKLYHCYEVVGLRVASPGVYAMFLSVGEVFVCIWEASERCVPRRRQAEDEEVAKIRAASYQLVDLRLEALLTDANWKACTTHSSTQPTRPCSTYYVTKPDIA